MVLYVVVVVVVVVSSRVFVVMFSLAGVSTGAFGVTLQAVMHLEEA